MALSFCQHIVIFWIFHALSFHGCQASSKNSQLNHTIEAFEAHLIYDFDELSISIIGFFNPYLHFTISFFHISCFRFALSIIFDISALKN